MIDLLKLTKEFGRDQSLAGIGSDKQSRRRWKPAVLTPLLSSICCMHGIGTSTIQWKPVSASPAEMNSC
jgi:hypothetical protein